MTESGEQPLFDAGLMRSIGGSVGDELLIDKNYADLRVNDLVRFEVIPEGVSFPDAIGKMLALDKRISTLSWKLLLERVPAPTGNDAVRNVVPNMLISEQEERTVRLGILNRDEDGDKAEELLAQVRESAKTDMQTLALEIVQASQQESNQTYIEEDLKYDFSNPSEVVGRVGQDRFMNSEPTLIKVSELGYCFALSIPREGRSFIGGLAPTLDSYLIVTDPALNSKLADTLFSSPALLKHFVLKVMVDAQLNLKHRVDDKFSDAALKKYPEMQKAVENVTSPLQTHVFDLMQHALEGHEVLYVTHVFRDDHDAAVLKGKSKPKADRTGSESGPDVQVVKKGEKGDLIFEVDSSITYGLSKKDPNKRMAEMEMVNLPRQVKVRVFKDEVGTLQFDQLPSEIPEIPQGAWRMDQEGKESERVSSGFEYMANVLRVDQLREHGQTALDEGKKVVSKLLQTKSLAEYFSGLRGTRMYPYSEYFASVDHLTYVVDHSVPGDSLTNFLSKTGKRPIIGKDSFDVN